jgi:formate dehydrogenase beta subunit
MARKPRSVLQGERVGTRGRRGRERQIVVNRSPKSFVTEGGKLKGMMFDVMEYDVDANGRITAERVAARNSCRPTT